MSTLNCPACAAPCQPMARFCGQCGHALTPKPDAALLDIDLDPDDELLEGPADPEADTRPAPLGSPSPVTREEVDLLLDDGPAPSSAPASASAPIAASMSTPVTASVPAVPPIQQAPCDQGESARTATLYAGLGFAAVALAAALGWWLWGGKAVAPSVGEGAQAPSITLEQVPSTPAPSVTAQPHPPVAVAPPPARSAQPAARPADPAPAASGTAAGNEPPWPHAGTHAPAPPPALSRQQSAPQPASEGLGPLRAALRQCDRDDNLLTRGVCVVRARHQHCGSNWGKVPECPMSNRNNDPYTSN